MNYDAVIGDSSSTIEVIAKDWRGLLVFAVSRKVDTNTPIQAEAEAILWAMNLVCQANFDNVIFEGDYRNCIKNSIHSFVIKSGCIFLGH